MNISDKNDTMGQFFATVYGYAALGAIPVTAIGLMANLLLIIVFIIDKSFHKTTYYLLIISICSDIAANISALSTFIQIAEQRHNYQSGTLMCQCYVYVYSSSYTISIMTLCLNAIDRYFAIVRPLSSFYRIYKRFFLISGEIIIWILSLSLNIPTFFFMSVHRKDTLLCDYPTITTSVSIYFITFVLIENLLPAFLISIIYFRIIIHQRNYIQPGQILRNRTQYQIRRNRLTKMLMSISICYIITAIPLSCVFIGSAITQKSLIQIRQESLLAFLLIFFSISFTASIATINPFLYLKFDVVLRERSKSTIGHIITLMYTKSSSTFIAVLNNLTQTQKSEAASV